jgi:hypothetical protein
VDTIGLSKSTQHLVEPDRRGFWPHIADAADAAHRIYTGSWMVLWITSLWIVVSTVRGNPASAAIEGAFFILGAAGIVCASRFAAAGTFAAVALLFAAMSRHHPFYSLLGLIPATLFILHAMRGVWFLNRTGQSLPPLNRNRFLNAMGGAVPREIWRVGRHVFYALAAVGLPWLVYRVFAPVAPGAKWRGVVEFPWM